MLPYALPAQVYAAGLVFLRVGAIVMLMPGVGEGFVPPRIRLAFALLLALCLGPIAQSSLPPIPSTVGDLGGQVLKELIIGLMLGGLLRFFLSALSVAGEVIAIQTTLAFAQTANPIQAQPPAMATAPVVPASEAHEARSADLATSPCLRASSSRLDVGSSVLDDWSVSSAMPDQVKTPRKAR